MVYVLLGEGFEESEAIVPVDLLRRAGAEVTLVGLGGSQVRSSHGIVVQADAGLDQVDLEAMEMLVLPGGLGGLDSMLKSPGAVELVQVAVERGCWFGAICAAPSACNPCVWDDMGSAAVDRQAQVVADGRIITAQAAGAAFLFGLKLVEALKGPEAAEKVRGGVLYRG